MKRTRKYDPVIRERVRELWAQGISVHEMVMRLGISHQTICNWRKQMGLPARAKPKPNQAAWSVKERLPLKEFLKVVKGNRERGWGSPDDVMYHGTQSKSHEDPPTCTVCGVASTFYKVGKKGFCEAHRAEAYELCFSTLVDGAPEMYIPDDPAPLTREQLKERLLADRSD